MSEELYEEIKLQEKREKILRRFQDKKRSRKDWSKLIIFISILGWGSILALVLFVSKGETILTNPLCYLLITALCWMWVLPTMRYLRSSLFYFVVELIVGGLFFGIGLCSFEVIWSKLPDVWKILIYIYTVSLVVGMVGFAVWPKSPEWDKIPDPISAGDDRTRGESPGFC